jgi:hypothetical protein
MRRIELLLIGIALAAGGCTMNGGFGDGGPRSVDRVDRLDLIAQGVAEDWDDRPGPDGVKARLFQYQVVRREPVAVQGTGDTEFMLYEGDVRGRLVANTPAFYTWRLAPGQLRQYESQFYGIPCFAVVLPWGTRTPSSKEVTLVARYLAPDGSVLYSAPTSIIVGR